MTKILLRKIVIFTTEKNILADSTYMHVLEGVEERFQSLFSLSKSSTRRVLENLKGHLTQAIKILLLFAPSHIYLVKRFQLSFIKARSKSDELVLLVDEGKEKRC